MGDIAKIDRLPNEIFLHIFSYLPVKSLMRSRVVSVKWHQIVGNMIDNDNFWKRKCASDFGPAHTEAKARCRSNMTWFEIYRALCLWPIIRKAVQVRQELCHTTNPDHYIKGCVLLRDGVIGVHNRSKIQYFNIETLAPIDRPPIVGEYLKYSENEQFIVLLSTQLQMQVLRKIPNEPHQVALTAGDVKLFLLLPHAVYFIDSNQHAFMCKFNKDQLEKQHIGHFYEKVLSLGYTDTLQVLLPERKVYKLVDDKLAFAAQLGSSDNLVDELFQYNLLETLDWNLLFQWMYDLHLKIPTSPIHDISIMRIYGDLVLVGTSWGVVRMLLKPRHLGKFNVFDTVPLWHYNFLETNEYEQLALHCVLTLDVYEKIDGHIMVVAMAQKILVINYSHKVIFTPVTSEDSDSDSD